MNNTVKRVLSLMLAAMTVAACLSAGGCGKVMTPPIFDPSKEEAAVSQPVQDEPENVPAEYRDLFAGGSFDEDNIWTTDDEKYAELVEAMLAVCSRYHKGSVIAATDDKVLLAGGWDSVETDKVTTVNPFTTYEIGSVTKQFCAVSILQQVQAGKLDVNDTIDKYFPEYPHGSKITVDNLLHMDSGIPEMLSDKFHGGDFSKNEAFVNGTMADEELLEKMYSFSLDFEPGTRFAYSNTNYWLLALILEQVTGQRYEDYVAENIFTPCGMTSSSACATGDLTSAPELGYDYMYTARNCRGAGDIHSNVCDILRWDRALFSGKLLDEEQMEYMATLRKGYSCGWMDDGFNGLGHSGSTWGYVSYNMAFNAPDGERVYVIIMTGNQGCVVLGLQNILKTAAKKLG